MSDIEREAFEKRNPVPEDAVWIERKQGYYWSNYPNVNHPFNNDWMIWEEAIEWQSARQAPASGEVGPVAWSLRWPEDEVVNAETTFRTEELARRYANRCQGKVTVVPLYTHPPAKVPEGIIQQCEAAINDAAERFGGTLNGVRAAQKKVRELLTTPTPATTPEAEWVKCADRLPTQTDGDERCSLWVSGLYENTGNRFVMMAFVGEAIDLAKTCGIDYFMPTGLKRPTPPQEQ